MITIETRIADILRAEKGIYFCDACLALKIGVSLHDAQIVLGRLAGLADFKRAEAQCSECLRKKVVVYAPGARSWVAARR